MLAEILIPIRWNQYTSAGSSLPAVILAGIANAVITIIMVFAIAWATHKGWNAV